MNLRKKWEKLPNKDLIKLLALGSLLVWCLFMTIFWFVVRGPVLPWTDSDSPTASSNSAQESDALAGFEEAGPPAADMLLFSPAGESLPEEPAHAAGKTESRQPAFSGGASSPPAPVDATAHCELALLASEKGDFNKTLAHLERVSGLPAGAFRPGKIAREGTGLSAVETALSGCRMQLQGQFDEARLLALEGAALFHSGHPREAEARIESAMQQHRGSPDLALTLVGMRLTDPAAWPEVEKRLLEVLRRHPGHAQARYQLGRLHQLRGDFREAWKIFRKLAGDYPRDAKARAQLGIALHHLRRLPEAAAEYSVALSLNPGDYNTWYNFGELRMLQSDKVPSISTGLELRRKALECYLQATELREDHARALFRAGTLLGGNGQHKEAIRLLTRALEKDPGNVRAMLQLAAAYEGLLMRDNARKILTQALDTDPTNKLVIFKLRQLESQPAVLTATQGSGKG